MFRIVGYVSLVGEYRKCVCLALSELLDIFVLPLNASSMCVSPFPTQSPRTT